MSKICKSINQNYSIEIDYANLFCLSGISIAPPRIICLMPDFRK
jgi:hypothetical protein